MRFSQPKEIPGGKNSGKLSGHRWNGWIQCMCRKESKENAGEIGLKMVHSSGPVANNGDQVGASDGNHCKKCYQTESYSKDKPY